MWRGPVAENVRVLVGSRGVALHRDIASGIVVAENRDRRSPHNLNPGKAVQRLACPFHPSPATLRGIAVQARSYGKLDDVVRFDSEINVAQVVQATDKKPCAYQQDSRQHHL